MTRMQDYLTDAPEYSENTVNALMEFKVNHREWKPGNPKPFEQVTELRFEGMQKLVIKLSAEMNVLNAPHVEMKDIRYGDNSLSSYYNRDMNTITMIGKLSIITLLHEFAHALYGYDESVAQKWSLCLYRKVYPKQFERNFVFEGESGVIMTSTPLQANDAVTLL